MNAQDLEPFKVVTFNARTASSRPIRVTREMLTDGIIDVGSYAEDEALRRMGRSWDDEFTDEGDGAGTRARSLKNSVTVGHNQTTADMLTYEDILALIYSVNRAYRIGRERGEGGRSALMGGGRKGFLITDSAEKALMGLKDGEDRPLWIPSIRDGESDRILKWPYEVTTALDGDHTSAPNTAYMWFGDFNYFGIRTVGSVELFRFFDSRTAQNNAIEVLGFSAQGRAGDGCAGRRGGRHDRGHQVPHVEVDVGHLKTPAAPPPLGSRPKEGSHVPSTGPAPGRQGVRTGYAVRPSWRLVPPLPDRR